MRSDRLQRCEEHRHHPAQAQAQLCVESAQCRELHALLKANDFAHGAHLVATRPHSETMKFSTFRGEA